MKALKLVIVDDELPMRENIAFMTPVCVREIARPTSIVHFYIKAILHRGHSLVLIKDAALAIEWFSQPRPDIDALILDIQMPVGNLPWGDQFNTGIYVMRKVLEFQCLRGLRTHRLPIAVLTQVGAENYRKVKEEHKQQYPDGLWISKKNQSAFAWVCNLETWLSTGKIIDGV